MEKISAVYKIINTITGDFYVGSSKDVKRRWASYKWPSVWKKYPNKQLYLDMQKLGVDKFEFEILAEVEIEHLKETEQKFIEKMHPTYNNYNTKGWNIERLKKSQKKASRKYEKTDKCKKSQKRYRQSDKGKESHRKYDNQLCFYNGETLTLRALVQRFWRKGLTNPTQEAKKYLIKKESKTPIEFYDVYP